MIVQKQMSNIFNDLTVVIDLRCNFFTLTMYMN